MKIGQRLRIKQFLKKTVNERPFLSKNLFLKVSRQDKSLSIIKQKQRVPQDSKDHPFGGEKEQTKNQWTKKIQHKKAIKILRI